MRYSRSARSLLAGTAAACALFTAGCGGSSSHHGASTPATSKAPAPGPVVGPTSPGGPAGTATGTAAPYPTPGKEPSLESNQISVLNALPGSTSATTCAVVGGHTDVRSASFAAGNFAAARKKYTSDVRTTEAPEVFLYLIPQNAKGMRAVTVTVDPTGPGATRKVTSKSVEQAEAWSYFAVNVPVPAPGGYRLTVVSGANKGCFEVSFSR